MRVYAKLCTAQPIKADTKRASKIKRDTDVSYSVVTQVLV